MSKVLGGIKKFIINNVAWSLLVVTTLIFATFSKDFLSLRNFLNILNQNAYIIIAGLGVSMVMMSGNMDLSVGYAMSINGVVCALLHTKLGFSLPAVIVVCIGLGICLSLANVVLSRALQIPYIFITFGTMTIYQGLAYVLSNSKTISGFTSSYKFIGQGTIGNTNISVALVIMFALLGVFSFIMNKTYFGRYVFALGGNKEATKLSGINTDKIENIIGVFCGAMVGLASLMQSTRIGAATASTSVGIEFTIIVGLLLGGVSIRGGQGKINGCVAGILLVAILSNGMQMAGLNIYYQYVVKGLIMLVTVGVDTFQLRKKAEVSNKKAAQKKTE